MERKKSRQTITVCLVSLLMVLLAPNMEAKAEIDERTGHWVGGYEVGGEWHFVEARLDIKGEERRGVFDFRHDRTTAILTEDLEFSDNGELRIALFRDESPMVLDGRYVADQIKGSVTVGKETGSFTLNRVVALEPEGFKSYIGTYQLGEDSILLYSHQDFGWYFYFDTASEREVQIYPLADDRFFSELGETIIVQLSGGDDSLSLIWQMPDETQSLGINSAPYHVEEVLYPHGDITLAGTLLLPNDPGPHPAIVIMHSTMPQNRDLYRRWGHFFAKAGIAVLVYDKPGAFDSSHRSLGSFWENTAESLAGAALAGVHYLQSRPEINPEQIGIRTYSNSSWAGPIAAGSDDVAFIIGTAVSGVAQRQADIFQEDLNNISYYDYPDWAAASALSYLRFTREFSIFARELALPLPAPYRDYYGVDFDPLTAWAGITQPVLIVNGEYDTLVDPVDAVARIGQTLSDNGHKDYTLVVYPDADHGLLKTETGLIAETRGGRDRVYAPGVMTLQSEWILARFDGKESFKAQATIVDSTMPVRISDHFEPNGRYELLPWYGRSVWQLFLTSLFALVFPLVLMVIPIALLVRRFRHKTPLPRHVGLILALAWSISLLGMALLAGLITTWVQIAHLSIGQTFGLPKVLGDLPVLAAVTVGMIFAYLITAIYRRRIGQDSFRGQGGIVLFGATSLLFIWYLGYWHLLPG